MRLYDRNSSPIAVRVSWDAGSGYSVFYTVPVDYVSGSACTLPAGTLAIAGHPPPGRARSCSGPVSQAVTPARLRPPDAITNVEELDGGQTLQITTDDGSTLGRPSVPGLHQLEPQSIPSALAAMPQRSATPTPRPTASPVPMTTDVDWPAIGLNRSDAGNDLLHLVTSPINIVGFGCDLPSKSVLGTSGFRWLVFRPERDVEHPTPWPADPMAVGRLESNQLVADLATSGQQVFISRRCRRLPP